MDITGNYKKYVIKVKIFIAKSSSIKLIYLLSIKFLIP